MDLMSATLGTYPPAVFVKTPIHLLNPLGTNDMKELILNQLILTDFN